MPKTKLVQDFHREAEARLDAMAVTESDEPPAVPLRGDEGCSAHCPECHHDDQSAGKHKGTTDASYRTLTYGCNEQNPDANSYCHCKNAFHFIAPAPSVDEGVPVPDYATEIAIGRDWTKYKESAKRIADRIADGDCLICQHWNADAVYAIAVELASHARTDLAPCSKCDQEMERVKACEHIAEGDEGWEQLVALCPSTMAVAGLRRLYVNLAAATPNQEDEDVARRLVREQCGLSSDIPLAKTHRELAERIAANRAQVRRNERRDVVETVEAKRDKWQDQLAQPSGATFERRIQINTANELIAALEAGKKGNS